MRVFIREILVIPVITQISQSKTPATLTSYVEVDQQRHVRGGGDLTLVLPRVPHSEVPDDESPVGGAGGVEGLQPQVGGVGVAAHRQQAHVRQPDPADLHTTSYEHTFIS